DRSDYVLEYRACAPTWAHYDPEVGSALRDFQGSWPRREEGAWKRVPNVVRLQPGTGNEGSRQDACPEPSQAIVAALLPALGQPHSGRMPDVVRFRLCALDRARAHPCRWAGGMSEPLAVAFAPPRRPPRIQRILSDERWNLSLTIELFSSSPPNPTRRLGHMVPKVGQVRLSRGES
ncbi:unnamed protein product, partial [Symbiodinium pilosum]